MIEVTSNAKTVSPWIAQQYGIADTWRNPDGFGFLYGDQLVGGCIFTDFTERSCNAFFAVTNPRWCTRGYLRFLSEYPFIHRKVRRVTSISRNEKRATKVAEQWGFKKEGCLREYFGNKEDAIIWGMLKEECRFL